MSERRKASAKNKTIAYIAAALIHIVIIGAMLVNFSTKHKKVEAVDADEIAETIKATTIDESQIKDQQKKLKDAERERQRKKELERQRLERLKKETEQEQQKIEDLKKKQELEQEKAAELEKQRKEIALKKKQEEEKRKKEEEKRKKLEAERKKEEARQKKLAEEKRLKELERIEQETRELEAQRRLNESLAAEEAFLAEQRAKQRATTLMGKYSALIKEKVGRYRTIAPDFESWRVTKVNVKLSPSGDVKSVRIINSSGNVRYDRSVETAIYQASPLPIPSFVEDPEVNEQFQNLNLNFDMKGLR